MVVVLIANGFEEIEALTPVDLLRRAGLEVRTVGVNGLIATGAHKVNIFCDDLPEDIDLTKVTMAIFPGGMPGAINLDASPFADEVIETVMKNGGRLAAICAAPLVFGRRDLLKGKKATCYPGFENELVGATVVDKSVVTDGNITTARGMGVATEFALELISLTCGEEVAKNISSGICRENAKRPEEKRKSKADLASAMEDELTDEIRKTLDDTKFYDAVKIVMRNGAASTALVQRGLSIGYGRAARYIDAMEALGIVSAFNGQRPRDVILTQEECELRLSEISKKLKSET